jgi:hypothetical protein
MIASSTSSGNRTTVNRRTIWRWMSAISLALRDRASTGKPTWPITMLTFFWYSIAIV